MPKLIFIDVDGSRNTVVAPDGATVMETALSNGVDAIVAECGGNMTCATCHVYVDEAWWPQVGERSADEDEMLQEAISPREPTSRLSCQIVMSEALDGLVVRLPEEQV